MSGLQPKGRKTSNIGEAKADVTGPCPFCHTKGGNITVDWGDEKRDGALFHSLPYCETYSRLTADEFVRAVIERRHLS